MKKNNGSMIVIGLVLLAGMLAALVLKGRVVNENRIPVAGALVTATRQGSPVICRAKTANSGTFLLKDLAPGTYDLTVQAAGYETLVKKEVVVTADGRIGEDLVLKSALPVRVKNREQTWKQLPVPMAEERRMGGITASLAARDEAYPPDSYNTEEYQRIYEDRFQSPLKFPLSTFSIDVDTASYANIRRFVNQHQMPYRDAVRIEEMINYFDYHYPLPRDSEPFAIYSELSGCPWEPQHRLLHIGLKGRELKDRAVVPSNLVFLIDVSGSMNTPAKLPLLKRSFKILVERLSDGDRVAVVVYAGAAGLVLASTPGTRKDEILAVLDRLEAGGSTAGGAGIRLAYQVAMENRIPEGNNRIILATDGDFNVGISSTSEMVRLIEEKKDQGIFLTVLGFGTGNTKDYRMEQLADRGDGNYFYIDNILEGKKVFSNEMTSTLFTIAKDVKIQVEFNPVKVASYRLIGYENRKLNREDFQDDTKDAGDLGAGHTVTALYEIVPCSASDPLYPDESLRYQNQSANSYSRKTRELATVKLRYKEPGQSKSRLLTHGVLDRCVPLSKASENFKFSAAVAQWGLLLRDSKFKGSAGYDSVLSLARDSRGADLFGYRGDFIRLVEKARLLSDQKK